MISKRHSLLLILGLFAMSCEAGDWSEWWHQTPGQNEISNENWNDIHRNIFTCKQTRSNRARLQFIEKWYFYKGHVIGTLMPNQPNLFFIINEKTCSFDTFNTYIEFDKVLHHKGLKPVIWTRWYNSNWGFFFVGSGYGGSWDFLWFRGTWLLFPLMPLAIVWFISNYSKKTIKWLIGLAFLVFMVIQIIMDFIPGSI